MDNLPNLSVYMFQPNWGGLFSMILTVLLPLGVAVVTTRVTSPRVKAVLLLILAAIKTTVEALIANGNDVIHFAWAPFLINIILSLVVAGAAHFIAWKPTGASKYIQENFGVKTPVIDGEHYDR